MADLNPDTIIKSIKTVIKIFFMKIFAYCFLPLLFHFPANAQNTTRLTGKIIDGNDSSAVVSASVALLANADSAYVAGNSAGEDGRFVLKNISGGRYILKVSSIGYVTAFKNITVNENRTENSIGRIALEQEETVLAEATVIGKTPEVTMRNDTIEYDARSVKTTENAVVEDILKKLPGVEVSDNGKITVNGKEVKRFMVEGKEFFSDDPQIASKNLPAEIVDKLQVLDRKSDMAQMTGFDDGEEETIINLTIREGMKKGTMGNVLLGGGQDLNSAGDTRYQAGAFINNMTNNDRYTLIVQSNNNNNTGAADLGTSQFRGMRMRRGEDNSGIMKSLNPMLNFSKEFSKTFTLTGDLRYNGLDRNVDRISEQVRYSNISRMERTHTVTNYLSDNFASNIKMEWKPDSMNNLTLRPNFYFTDSHSTEEEWASQLNFNTMDTISDSYGKAATRGSGYNFGATLDYSHRFNKPGRVFSVNARFRLNDSYSVENDNSEIQRYTDENASISGDVRSHSVFLNQQAENDNRSNEYRTTFAWVEPLGNNNFLQLQYRLSNSDSRSINSTYDIYPPDAVIADSLSRSTVRKSTEQRFGIAFKSSGEKYNYTAGLNFDPTRSENNTWQPGKALLNSANNPYSTQFAEDSRLNNIIGDSLYSTIRQDVRNFSPVAKFKYTWDKRTNLKLDYDGETNQPSALQLRDYIDKSRPYEWTAGNPDLKPGYSSQLRAAFQKFVPESQLSYNIGTSGNFSFSDIASVTRMQGDSVRISSYKNISGNWDINTFGTVSLPLKNRKFSVRSMIGPRYVNLNTYVDDKKNTQHSFSFMNSNGVNYRSDLFDAGLNITVNFNNIKHTIQPENNKNTVSYGLGGTNVWYLPAKTTLESEITFTKRNGYDNYNISETMWNAAATKHLFSKKAGTGLLKLQIYDILKNRKNIMSAATIDGYQITSSNVIPSYFMCSFIYKFTSFPKSSSATEEDMQNSERRQWDGPPPADGRRRSGDRGFGGGRPPF
ncbi:MAG: outer membrane beta-barrel protein [Dysgonamonadaceae bacterium]|jgi:hypothetical protein|nr:outer membrane beta-barrel protein [Dysgonamonadaceae bacterium]